MIASALFAAPVAIASAAPPPPARVEPPSIVVAIDLDPGDGPAWFAAGLEQMTKHAIVKERAVEIAPKIDRALCPGHETRCIVDRYREKGAAVVVSGRVDRKSALVWDIQDTRSEAPDARGTLTLAGEPSAVVERRIDEMLRPVLQHGGLLDRRVAPDPAPPAADGPAPKIGTAKKSRVVLLVALAAIALVTSPILLLVMLAGVRELARREMPRSWKWSALLLASLAPLPILDSVLDLRGLVLRAAEPGGGALAAIVPLATGMLWGTFALTIGTWLFAPVNGMGRIRADALWPLLRAWLLLALLRAAALAAIQAPVLWLAWRAAAEVALPRTLTLAFVVPVVGLFTHVWLLTLVDNLAVYLDVALVRGPATARNPWHVTIKRYFGGYLRRNGVEIPPSTLDRTLFLPSARADVVAYGGGFARPRILVGERPREAALGELPDEEELPQRTVNPEELPLGFVLPSLRVGEDAASLARAQDERHRAAIAPPRRRAPMPRRVGENATLLGWITPDPADAGLPLISDTEDDFGVVKKLLTEHYSAFERNVDGDEVDDTDPSQKDFLFGAVLREIGVALRGDAIFATLRLAFDVMLSRIGFVHRLVARPPMALYDRFLSAPAARIGDAYVALNGAFHHLVQYLAFLRGTDEALLTARANEPRMVAASHAMLARMEADEPTSDERHAFRATPRARVAWLTRYFHAPLVPGRVHWARVAIGVVVLALGLVLFARSVREAIAYHPTWVARTSAQARVIEGEKAR